jgi:hypothetical protein
LFADAGPEKMRPIARILGWEPSSDKERAFLQEMPSQGNADCGMRIAEWEEGTADAGCSMLDTGRKRKEKCVFRWTGRDWMVVFDGEGPFYLPPTLGARYVDYLLHHPNLPIPAFDLEVLITPEKAAARCINSIQRDSDALSRRQYREALDGLKERAKEAQLAGNLDEAERLREEIAAYESALKESGVAPDTGRRAYNNVRYAVGAVRAHLSKGGPAERAFAEQLRLHLSIGLECLYTQADGLVWA